MGVTGKTIMQIDINTKGVIAAPWRYCIPLGSLVQIYKTPKALKFNFIRFDDITISITKDQCKKIIEELNDEENKLMRMLWE